MPNISISTFRAAWFGGIWPSRSNFLSFSWSRGIREIRGSCVIAVCLEYCITNPFDVVDDHWWQKWWHFWSLTKYDIFVTIMIFRLVILNSYVWKSEWTHFDQMYACSIISITPLGPFEVFVDSRPDWIFDFLKYLNLDSKLHFCPILINFGTFLGHQDLVPLLLGILLPTFNKTKDDKVDRDSSSISFKYSNSIHVFTRRIPHLTHLW